MSNQRDELTIYAMALDSDIKAEPWQHVRNSVLWKGYVGTICGNKISTEERGFMFNTRAEAIDNAKLARTLAQGILNARSKPSDAESFGRDLWSGIV